MTVKMNSIDIYAESGRRQALAVNENDPARALLERNWRMKALQLEDEDYRREARKAADYAYQAARRF